MYISSCLAACPRAMRAILSRGFPEKNFLISRTSRRANAALRAMTTLDLTHRIKGKSAESKECR